MENIDYTLLAKAIAKELRELPEVDKVLWDAKRCAEYLTVSERHFVDWLSKQHRFPDPVVLPSRTDGNRGQKRWYTTDVTAWAQLHKRAA